MGVDRWFVFEVLDFFPVLILVALMEPGRDIEVEVPYMIVSFNKIKTHLLLFDRLERLRFTSRRLWRGRWCPNRGTKLMRVL